MLHINENQLHQWEPTTPMTIVTSVKQYNLTINIIIAEIENKVNDPW